VTASRVFLGLRPSPFSLSRLLGFSRLSAGSVRKAPRTPLLSLASSSEYDRRRLPNLQAGPASSPRVSSPPAHAGTRGPPTRGSQSPIRSPLSVSHALRGFLPLVPSWAYPIPLALLGFHLRDPPRSRPPHGEDPSGRSHTWNREPEGSCSKPARGGRLRRASLPGVGLHPVWITPRERLPLSDRQA
jgi:hypothetical protein